MSRLLNELNERQQEAVTTTEGPLLVIAGAGSGKTRVLTRRVAYILTERLAEPWQLMAVTFTNKAAGEMKERIASFMGGELPGLNVSTFHSFCARFLRSEGEALGYERNFTIFDAADSATLVKNCIKELSLSSSQFTPKAQMRKISNAKNNMVSSSQFAQSAQGYFESTTAQIYTLYQQRLRECNSMDFDDLLFNAVALLKSNEEVSQRYQSRFRYLMVDEYQDTNQVQYLLLKNLLGVHNNICVVGDEDQAIYGWRGADIRNILEFEKDFPGARVIKLEQNYRSTSLILSVASSVIANNEARKGKTLWTDQDGGDKLSLVMVDTADEEAAEVVRRIDEKERLSASLNEIAVLYRTNAQSRPLEEQLRRKNIPYQIVGGISFYQRKEIKDFMAYLKLLVNERDDVSFQRVVNYPKRGIGQKTVDDVAVLARRDSMSFLQVARRADEYPELGSRAKKLIQFASLIEKYRERQETQPLDLMAGDLVEELKLFEDFLAEDQTIGQTRVENIEAFLEGLAGFARSHSDATLTDYLAEISLFTDLDSYRELDEKITLMTLHTAKGLEYDSVFLVGLEEGLFPLGNAISDPEKMEEERRLFYVGATRARKRLCLSSATTRYRFGEVESIPSRFIKEIPEELIEKIDLRRRRHYEYTNDRLSGGHAAVSHRNPRPAAAQPQGVHYEFEEEEAIRVGRVVQHPTF
ncbi:MAG: UvrD-helicase domain-containing protein, partial [bacterium]|nr:UvrD-helicase domain-containing protein [bacterium]